jgi:hypothetical protein
MNVKCSINVSASTQAAGDAGQCAETEVRVTQTPMVNLLQRLNNTDETIARIEFS